MDFLLFGSRGEEDKALVLEDLSGGLRGWECNVMCFSPEIKSMNVTILLVDKHELELVPLQSSTPGPCSHFRYWSVQSPDTASLSDLPAQDSL